MTILELFGHFWPRFLTVDELNLIFWIRLEVEQSKKIMIFNREYDNAFDEFSKP